MTDANETPDNFGNPTVEGGSIDLGGDAAGAAIGADLSDDTADDAETRALDEEDGETLADKAALVDADSILDPPSPTGTGS